MTDRRDLLRAAGAGLAAMLAGCGGGPTERPATGQTDSGTPSAVESSSGTPAVETTGGTVPHSPTDTDTPTDRRLSKLERRVLDAVDGLGESLVTVDTSGVFPDGLAWFVESNLLVTGAPLSREDPRLRRYEGGSVEATLVGRSDADAMPGPGVAVYRTEEPGSPVRTADDPAVDRGQVLAHVGFRPLTQNWRPSYGRVLEWTDAGRFLTNTPLGPHAAPVVSLDGRVVAVLDDFRPPDGYSTEVPPTPASTVVHTSQSSWRLAHHTPVDEVLAAVERVTG